MLASLDSVCKFRARSVVDRHLRSGCLCYEVVKTNAFSLIPIDAEKGYHRQDKLKHRC